MEVVQIFGMNIQIDPDKYSNIPALAMIMDHYILNNKCGRDEKMMLKLCTTLFSNHMKTVVQE